MRVNLSESIMSSIKESDDKKFRYSLLSRLKSDCDYFLGNGNRHDGHLWAKDVDKQIAKMKELHNSFADDEKPEWLTIDQIDDYEKRMKSNEEVKSEEIDEPTVIEDINKLHEDTVYNHQGEKCPKCGSENYIEVDGAEFDDGTQEFKLVCADCGYESDIDELNHNDLNEAEELNNKLYIDLDEIIEYAISYVAEKTGATTDIQKEADGQFMVLLQGNEENYKKYMELHNEVINLLNN